MWNTGPRRRHERFGRLDLGCISIRSDGSTGKCMSPCEYPPVPRRSVSDSHGKIDGKSMSPRVPETRPRWAEVRRTYIWGSIDMCILLDVQPTWPLSGIFDCIGSRLDMCNWPCVCQIQLDLAAFYI